MLVKLIAALHEIRSARNVRLKGLIEMTLHVVDA